MDSLMVYVPVEFHMWPHAGVECTMKADLEVIRALEDFVWRNYMLEESKTLVVEFEVEVWYKEVDGVKKATDATCHTICPNFVKAWAETQAKKQVEQEEVKQNG